MIDETAIRNRYQAMRPRLDERGRRLFVAAEARSTGYGGVSVVARATGVARSTINRGLKDLEAGDPAPSKVRRAGGGRAALTRTDPTLLEDLRRLLESTTLGDPMRPLVWVSKSHEKLALALRDMGHRVSASRIPQLLEGLGYRRQVNRKSLEGGHHLEAPEFECKATLFATGNNVTLVGDMTRRAIVCRLDARMERPELREFEFDPIDRVLAHRGAYVAAAITIARAYRIAGRPNVCPPIGSYGEWTDAVRAPLIWLGEADPVKSMDALRGEDPELAPIREFFAHWVEAMPLHAHHTAAQIIDVACKLDRNGGFEHPEFRDLILRIAGDRGQPSSKSLGKWLTKINGRVVDNKRLEMSSDAKRGNRYKLAKQR